VLASKVDLQASKSTRSIQFYELYDNNIGLSRHFKLVDKVIAVQFATKQRWSSAARHPCSMGVWRCARVYRGPAILALTRHLPVKSRVANGRCLPRMASSRAEGTTRVSPDNSCVPLSLDQRVWSTYGWGTCAIQRRLPDPHARVDGRVLAHLDLNFEEDLQG